MLQPFVSAEQLGEETVLADVRWYLDGRSGRDAYSAGHLPGAVFVDLDAVLAAPGSPQLGRHPLPDPAAFAAALGELGIGDEDTVVAYDDAGGVIAARLVWMLRAIGGDAAVLDGGIAAFEDPLERTVPAPARKPRTARPWPASRLATIDDAVRADAVVLDARPAERYRGESETTDARPGHIPGARSLPCRENLDGSGRLLAPGELRRRLEAVGVADGREIVSYCGSGVTACHNLLVIEQVGGEPGRLFCGSWSQYAADAARPAELGADPRA